MDRYAVIGHPINHSKSPTIHQGFAEVTGQTLTYTAIEAPLDGFAATVDAFRAQGGRGVNVTVPFKLQACAYADRLSERARIAGAANALKFNGNTCEADNFDGMGLVRDLTVNLGHALRGRSVLLLGAGGASRGAVFPVLDEAPSRLAIVNRTAAKASALVEELVEQGASASVLEAGNFEDLAGESFDIVINATSASLSADALPLPSGLWRPQGLAYDMVYGKGLTPFLRQARDAGVTNLADGVGMLVEQAAEAFAWWRGVRPPTADTIRRISIPLV